MEEPTFLLLVPVLDKIFFCRWSRDEGSPDRDGSCASGTWTRTWRWRWDACTSRTTSTRRPRLRCRTETFGFRQILSFQPSSVSQSANLSDTSHEFCLKKKLQLKRTAASFLSDNEHFIYRLPSHPTVVLVVWRPHCLHDEKRPCASIWDKILKGKSRKTNDPFAGWRHDPSIETNISGDVGQSCLAGSTNERKCLEKGKR